MYKIINILLFIGVIHTSIFAETTKEDVDKYINVSRGGVIVKNTFLLRYKTYFSKLYNIDIKKANKKLIKEYKSFIFNSKYEDVFYKEFSKMDDNSYYEIMAFYKTKLGKKYTKSFKKLYEMDIRKELMISIIEKKGQLLLPKKRKLVSKINKALYSKLNIDLEKDIFVDGDSKAIKKYVLPSKDNQHISIKKKKFIIAEYFEVFSELAYKDFSDEELSQILEYAKTYGKIEMGVLHHALKVSIDALEQDLNNFIKSKKSSKNLDNNSSK